ncbi:MAG TPA: cytochrome c [Longimicrobiales bacterium]|nr:cytochrome c [Longimicrobiales bacterium]
MTDRSSARVWVVVAVLAIVVSACGDANTAGGSRGYRKAPLERPGPIVRGEQPGEMARYGGLNRVVAERIELPEQAAAAAAPAAPRPAVELPAGVTQEMVAQGETLYGSTGNCFTCHGADASGSPLAPGLNDSQWLHIDGTFDALVGIIAAGVPVPAQYPAAMPARGGGPLTDDEVRSIAAYVYTLSR